MDVNTVTGTISNDDLGWTMPHEHIVVAWDGTFLDSTLNLDMQTIEKSAVEKFTALKNQNVRSIVDMTTIEMGRDVELMRRVSEASGVQIVCITGVFADEYGIPHYFRELKPEELTDIYITEISEGIGRTGIKAGAIKVATGGREITPLEDRVLRCAAKAQVATGVPILTHTGRGAAGDEQVRILTEEGVPPSKIVVGHSDVSANLRYHLRLLRTGAYVGFDRIGLPAFMPDPVRAQCIAALIRLGHVERLTMSLDAHVRWCGRANELTEEERDFTTLRNDFFPLLRDAGVDDAQIEQMMVGNVRAVFG
jgi:phosphotriesterase-related protein